MRTVIREGKLALHFAEGWQAVKWDEQAWYRDGNALGGCVKGMDVVALGPDGQHWWIELKDCLGYEVENVPRLTEENPPEIKQAKTWLEAQGWQHRVQAKRKKPFIGDELLEKLVGTVAGLAAAARQASQDARAQEVAAFATAHTPGGAWSIALVLTWTHPDMRDYARMAKLLKTKLDQRLRAFGVCCYVVNETVAAPQQPWTVERVAS